MGILGVVFVTLKLLGVIHWSWWWVTLPFWGGWGLLLVLAFGGVLLLGVAAAIRHTGGKILNSRRRKL